MSSSEYFNVERKDHIVWFTLNRPEKRNTMTVGFFKALHDQFVQFDEDPDVRVIVMKAAGKSFCAGLDLVEASSELQIDGKADSREGLRRFILEAQESMTSVERCRKPVIAAVHSHCIGGGVNLICACDIRIASRDAIFSVRETRIGIICDVGTLQRLPHIIGHGWANELSLTGRDFTADEALQMGFITRRCENQEELYEEAGKLATQIANLPPLTVHGTKDVIQFSRDNGVHAGLHYVAQKNSAQVPSEDMFEALNAFVEKRQPEFKGK